MATWFEIVYTGTPTTEDYAKASQLVAKGMTSGQLFNESEAEHDFGFNDSTGRYGMHEHDGLQPHSHEVRGDHLGVHKY